MKDMNAMEIHADMNGTLGADCIGYSTVTKHLREKSFSKSMLDTDFEPKIEEENFIDEVIHAVLEEWSFSSLRPIVKRMFIPMSTVGCHSVNSLGYRIQNARRILHSLSSSQKQSRVEMNQVLLQVLRLAKHHAWKYVATLDEARFYFQIILIGSGFHVMNYQYLFRNKRLHVRNE
jgi:hypothetical protein